MKRESLFIVCCAMALAIAWTLFAGKDASWDVYNHHLYLPFSLLSRHYLTDLFAAGPQSYQNPIGYLPGYLLVRSALPAWAVGIMIAALQSALIAWPLHRIALTVWGAGVAERGWRLLAMATALTAPVLLVVLGTTSNDPLGAGLVLVALALSIDAAPHRAWRPLVAGAALGVALSVKLTAALFLPPLAALLILRALLGQARKVSLPLFAIGLMLAVMVTSWQWSSWLFRTFDSPVFPLFNQIFHSPFAPSGPTVALRFLPADAVAWLSRLWEIAEFKRYTYTEAFAPDARPLLLAVFAVLALAVSTLARPVLWRPHIMLKQPATQLLLLVLVVYALWLMSSGNARYALPWFLLVGLLSVRAMQAALPGRWAALTAVIVLGVQIAAYVTVGDRRYNEVPWDNRPYVEAEVPAVLAQQPYLHLSLGVQSYAAAALFLHPAGALINVSGQLALPMDGPLGKLLRSRLHIWEGRTRFLLLEPPAYRTAAASARLSTIVADAPALAAMDYLTYRFGLAIDWADCQRLVLDPHARPALTLTTGEDQSVAAGVRLLSCRAKRIGARNEALEARVAQADRVFALLEGRCPRIFGPRPFASEVGRDVVQRLYANSDARINVSPKDGVTVAHFRSPRVISLGTIEHVLSNRGIDACAAWGALWNH